jgi:hypothetical protein
MSILEGVGYVERDVERISEWQLAIPQKPLAQRLPFDVRHHVVEQSLDFPRGEHRNDVRMREVGDDFDLAEKTSSPQPVRQRYTVAIPPRPIGRLIS